MRRLALSATAAAILLAPTFSEAQELGERVRRAPDGWVRFMFEGREGICGHERGGISFRRDRDHDYGDWTCEEGPVRVELRVRDARIRDIDVEVAGGWDRRSGVVTDLGAVSPREASDALFDIAETAEEDVAKDAIFPATMGRGVESWPRLLEIARGHRSRDVRRQAVFWLGQEASERATEGLTSIIEDDGELEVREHAIFALSQRHEEPAAFETLMRLARSSPEPSLRRTAIFWLGQSDDPRVLELLEEILTRGG
ncbi:MAG: HEAT repeat domain-containing protein [Gemmatimonadetes bacterium]|nr:HEAT repeat domain-containing protein [Gemmatimonadota bacterium]